MTTHNLEGDVEDRRQQLVEHLLSLEPKQAEAAIGGFYHQLENEITKPDAGIYVTRYFISKWKPALGSDAANIVQALRLLSNPDGWTYASYETIANYAGVSQRAVERWLSDTPSRERGEEWLAQWTLLHTYFLRESKPRFRQRTIGNLSRVQRTTNSIRMRIGTSNGILPRWILAGGACTRRLTSTTSGGRDQNRCQLAAESKHQAARR